MSRPSEDRGGLTSDRVWLQIGDKDIDIAESYVVHAGIFHQPARFELRLGWGNVAWDLLQAHKPGDSFKVRINGNVSFTGQLDAVSADMGEGATTVTVSGRDALARLYDSYVEFEESFNDETFTGLVKRAMKKAGIKDPVIVASNAANRKIRTGVPVVQTGQPVVVDEVKKVGPHEFVGVLKKVQASKIGERWLDFIRVVLDRAGLFLWAAADGTYVLSAPNGQQQPVAHIVRRRGSLTPSTPTAFGNVVRGTFRNDTTARNSEVIVYGRSGRVRSKSKGHHDDAEMIAWGLIKPMVIRDTNVQSPEQAGFLARRKLAEQRREGYSLSYVVRGHSAPSLTSPGKEATWAPDTVVLVDDYELGIIHKLFYVEGVEYRRGPETTTTINLMRVDDLVFGDPTGK